MTEIIRVAGTHNAQEVRMSVETAEKMIHTVTNETDKRISSKTLRTETNPARAYQKQARDKNAADECPRTETDDVEN